MSDKVADEIISYFSYDAYYWRPKYVSSPPEAPIQIFFKFADSIPVYGSKLLAALANRIVEPYVTEDWENAAPIIGATSDADADAVVIFTKEELVENQVVLSYELYAKDATMIGAGEFSLYDNRH